MNLELRHESGGPRHYLAGRDIHCGDQIEIQVAGPRGPWVPVRYEASIRRNDGDEQDTLSVCLYAIGARIYYDNDAAFRWPCRA